MGVGSGLETHLPLVMKEGWVDGFAPVNWQPLLPLMRGGAGGPSATPAELACPHGVCICPVNVGRLAIAQPTSAARWLGVHVRRSRVAAALPADAVRVVTSQWARLRQRLHPKDVRVFTACIARNSQLCESDCVGQCAGALRAGRGGATRSR